MARRGEELNRGFSVYFEINVFQKGERKRKNKKEVNYD